MPVNFTQTSVTYLIHNVLQFNYTWGSSSGNLSDLGNCNVREYVTYTGGSPFYWPSPPYVSGSYSPNPDTGLTPGPATAGTLVDQQGHQLFVKPYAYSSVTSNQVFQFQCTYYKSNQWVNFLPITGTIPITRTVQSVSGTWQYSITKSGSTDTGTLP